MTEYPDWERNHRAEKFSFWMEFVKALLIFFMGVALIVALTWAVMLGKS